MRRTERNLRFIYKMSDVLEKNFFAVFAAVFLAILLVVTLEMCIRDRFKTPVVPPKLQKDINIPCLFVFPLTPESRAAPRRRLQDGTPALIGKTFQPVGFSLSARCV